MMAGNKLSSDRTAQIGFSYFGDSSHVPETPSLKDRQLQSSEESTWQSWAQVRTGLLPTEGKPGPNLEE